MRCAVYTLFISIFLAACIDVPGRVATVGYQDPNDSGDVWLLTMLSAVNLTKDAHVHENVSFGPDGKIYFSRQNGDDDLSSEIWKMNPNGTGQVQLTDNDAVDRHPTISPDNTKVVWWSTASGNHQLWMMNTDGTEPKNLINDPNISTFDPEYSPDGSMIAFNVSLDGGHHAEIWIGELNGAGDEFTDMWSVTNSGYEHTEVDPTWAPNGLTLAYSVYEGPGFWRIDGVNPFLDPEIRLDWKIYLIDLDLVGKTGLIKELLVGKEAEPYSVSWLPCFSSDGQQVAFVRSFAQPEQWPGPYPFETTSSRLHVINVDGTEDRPIKNTEGCYFFDWVP